MNSHPHPTLGFMETVCHVTHQGLAGNGQLIMVGRVRGPLEPEMVERAVRILYDRHPMLRTTIHKSGDGYRFEHDRPFNIPIRVLERTDEWQWRRVVEKETNEIIPVEEYGFRGVVIAAPPAEDALTDLVFSFTHAISDGISITLYGHDLMECLTRMHAGEDPSLPPLEPHPPSESLIPASPTWEAYLARLAEDKAAVSHIRPHPVENTAPLAERRTRNVYQIFEGTLVNKLHQRCHHEYTTINSALGAALLLALRRMHGGEMSTVLESPLSLRNFCEPNIGIDHFCQSAAVVNTTHEGILENSPFWRLARDYNCQLTGHIHRDPFNPAEFPARELERMLLDGFSDGQTHFQGGHVLTNLGFMKFPRRYGPFSLDFCFFTTNRNGGGNPMALHVCTISDKMFCCFSYAHPLRTEPWVRGLAEAFTEILEANV